MDRVSPQKRSEIMRQIKSKDTKIEQKIRSALWMLGYRFRKHEQSLPGTPDIVFPGAKTVVFIDSCFWHGCPIHLRMPNSNKEYWENKIRRNRMRDQEVNQCYEDLKWQAVRIWEHTIADNFEQVIESLTEMLDRRYNMSSLDWRKDKGVIRMLNEEQ